MYLFSHHREIMADEDTRAMAAAHKQMKKILFTGLHKEWVFHTLYEGGKITIKTIKGDGFTIDADYTDTIADLKVRVGVALKRPAGQLYSGSLLLDDHRTLFHYLIPIGSTLQHVTRGAEGLAPMLPTTQQRLDQHIDQFWRDEYVRKIIAQKQYEQRYGLSSRFTI